MTEIVEPTIRLIDDDPSVLRALSRLLSARGHSSILYASAEAFLADQRPEPGCAIVDLHLPGADGLELQDRLATYHGRLPLIFLTGYGDMATGVQAMRSGAVDFLTKPVEGNALLAAVDRALAMDRELRASRSLNEARNRALASLTTRENEVLALLLEGLLNKQIASRLGVVEKTIKVHRARIMRKTGARTVADLFRMMFVGTTV